MTESESYKKAIHPIAIFKEGFAFWQRNFLCLGAIYFILYSPAVLLPIFLSPKPGEPNVCALKINPVGFLSSAVIFLAQMLLGSWMTVALVMATNKLRAGLECKIMESIKEARRCFLPYLGTIILSIVLSWSIIIVGAIPIFLGIFLLFINKILGGIILLIGVVACSSAFVYFFIRWSLSYIACVMEDKGPVGALKRSYYLTKKYVNPVVGEYCLLMLLFVPFIIPVLLAALLKDKNQLYNQLYLYQYIYFCLIGLVTAPLGTSIFVVLYQKLKEAVE